jgi:hypothetical protein
LNRHELTTVRASLLPVKPSRVLVAFAALFWFVCNLLIHHRLSGQGAAPAEAFCDIYFTNFRIYAILWRFSLCGGAKFAKES